MIKGIVHNPKPITRAAMATIEHLSKKVFIKLSLKTKLSRRNTNHFKGVTQLFASIDHGLGKSLRSCQLAKQVSFGSDWANNFVAVDFI
jgi:hypothetical protein